MLKTVEAISRTSAGNTWVNANSSTTLSFFQMTGAASQLRALASKNSHPNSCFLSRGLFRLLSSHGARAIPVVGSKKQRRFKFSASGCRCSQKNGHVRAWVVYKEGRMASMSAWFHAGRSAGDFAAESLTGRCGSEYGGSDDFSGDEEQGSEPEKQDGEEGKTNSVVSSNIERQRLPRERRQIEVGLGTASSVSAASLPGNPDLLMIPGVGPRNLRKLVDKGIGGVTELKQLYRDKFYGESSKKMVNFLQSSVRIIHRHHAESITSFIKHSVDEEMKEDIPHSDEKHSHRKRLTFCVEGNISVGKTTFLHRIANDTIELRDLVEVVPEPISKWQDVGPDHFNVLDAFYAEPHRYAYTFQNYVFVTRVMQERESAGGIKPLRLMERSIFSDRMVFVRAVHEANWMNEMEISIYDSWFDPVVSCLPGLIPDGFIYLRASPDTCHKRLKIRKRAEEGGVTLDYLRDLHEKHESWLFPFQSGNHSILSVSQLLPRTDNSLHPVIRDRVFYLEGEHMHSSIQKVPALVLDCEPDIDFSKDFESKKVYARQVAEFFEYVKKKKEVSSEEGSDGRKSMNPQILLPCEGGFLVPEGNHLPQSLDLRTMSFMST